MAEQTTQDGITVSQIDDTYEVLEVIRENLSDDGMNNLAEIINEAHYLVQQYDEGANWSEEYDLPEVGDILHDTEHNRRFGDGNVEVVEVTNVPSSRTYYDGHNTVAQANPEHPPEAPVVKATYVTGSDKVYHFPVTRLDRDESEWP